MQDKTLNATEIIGTEFLKRGISEFGFLPIGEAVILHPRLLPANTRNVIIAIVPYDSGERYEDGISRYAHVKDYHKFFQDLFQEIIRSLKETFPDQEFTGFADHSPINEKIAAAKAGLGVIGTNSLLINPRYGSYVFIGALFTDLKLAVEPKTVRNCCHCGKCVKACPVRAIDPSGGIDRSKCLSALSQRKQLSKEDLLLLKNHHVAWGCDICQEACPMNRTRIPTDLPYFQENKHGPFSADEIAVLSEEAFREYAFSWRGRNRILENLRNISSPSNTPSESENADESQRIL